MTLKPDLLIFPAFYYDNPFLRSLCLPWRNTKAFAVVKAPKDQVEGSKTQRELEIEIWTQV